MIFYNNEALWNFSIRFKMKFRKVYLNPCCLIFRNWKKFGLVSWNAGNLISWPRYWSGQHGPDSRDSAAETDELTLDLFCKWSEHWILHIWPGWPLKGWDPYRSKYNRSRPGLPKLGITAGPEHFLRYGWIRYKF